MIQSYQTWSQTWGERFPGETSVGLFTLGPAEYSNHEFVVHLPHMCDEWIITDNPVKADAIRDMEQFVADAQIALDQLREFEEGATQ